MNAHEETGLAVFVRSHGALLAIPSRRVVRLALASEVSKLREGAPGLLDARGTLHASFDLGKMMADGGAPSDAAVVLFALPHGSNTLAIALRTGPCVAVEPMPRTTRLPAGAFAARTGAVSGAFERRGAVCFAVDPSRLFTRAELDASAALLRDADAA